MQFKKIKQQLIILLLLFLTFFTVIGWLSGYVWQVLFIATLALLIWQYQQLIKLYQWLWQSKSISPPESRGLWGKVFDGLNRKIRKQRQKQKQLSKQIRLFKDGAEALLDGAVVLSQDFTIFWANSRAQTLIGVKQATDVGQRIDNLIRLPAFIQYLKKGDFTQYCSIESPINKEIQLEIRIMPYGVAQFLLLARDISQVHRMENMRKDFVANVSHELKTPLTVVRGYLEMFEMSSDDLNPTWKKAFNTMETQVTRMDNLVEQLLQLSKVEETQEVTIEQPLDMPSLLHGLIDDAQWLNKDKEHEITANIDDSLTIKGIETEIKSACSNLIANAINYTPSGGSIVINWQLVDEHPVFSVKDNGVGIRAEHLNRLTERFYRVDSSRSRDTGGSGLGLAIVKHVLSRHHAKLSIESTFGQGSTFMITFLQKYSRI